MNVPLYGPALVTIATVVLLLSCAAYVASARGKYGVKAPATSGHPQFEVAHRIHMNTLENTVTFLPALWLCAVFVNPLWASVGGAVWLAGRIWYALAYALNPKKRGGGFTLALLANGALLAVAGAGVLQQWFAWSMAS
ncbi:MAG TPA: MAPEG family protein [Burkholderiaceae bacterium]|nr:MAPEG family protein [Burkholderiaceae bacterium]